MNYREVQYTMSTDHELSATNICCAKDISILPARNRKEHLHFNIQGLFQPALQRSCLTYHTSFKLGLKQVKILLML